MSSSKEKRIGREEKYYSKRWTGKYDVAVTVKARVAADMMVSGGELDGLAVSDPATFASQQYQLIEAHVYPATFQPGTGTQATEKSSREYIPV